MKLATTLISIPSACLIFVLSFLGVGNKNPEKMAEDMYEAVTEFQTKLQGNLCIMDVRLVVFEEAMVDSVKRGLRNCFSKAGAAPKTFFRKVWDSGKYRHKYSLC